MKTNTTTTKPIIIAIALMATLTFLLRHNEASHNSVAAQTTGDSSPSSAAVKDSFGQLPLYFLANQGQLDRRVAFYVPGRDQTLFFTPQGITFALHNKAQWNLQLDFVGANPNVKPVGREQAEAEFNYFTGTPDQWQTGVKTYRSIVYENLWPGIDLVYSGYVNQMKYEFHVQPGADPAQIKLAYRGASSLQLTAAGALEIKTPVATFTDDQPVSYQEIGGQRGAVTTSYALARQGHSYGFRLGQYDRSQPLVIDPVMIVYCGYIGGTGTDLGTDIAVDKDGNAYVTGFTNSRAKGVLIPFPTKVGPELTFQSDSACSACFDAFVAKVSKEGKLIYCGYIGGDKADWGFGIAVDDNSRAYVVGQTASSKFPVAIGPKLFKSGAQDGFIARVSADGTKLEYCGYIGGGMHQDTAVDVAVDQENNAYVVGSTDSRDLPGVMAAYTGWNWNHAGGLADAYVVKIKDGGATVMYAGYLGGNQWDVGSSIDVDKAGRAVVGGFTQSSETTFLVKVGPDLIFNGSQDGFVARIDEKGSKLDYCGFIGGSGDDAVNGVAITSTGETYLVGDTNSTQATFPVIGAAADTTHNGGGDAFVARVKADGTGLSLSSFFGGDKSDSGTGISLDASDNAYITGATASGEKTFPVTDGPDLTYNETGDAFVAKLRADGKIFYCGYLGGKQDDYAWGIATNKTLANAEAFIVGRTNSTSGDNFPVKTGPDLTYNGSGPPLGFDAFVAKISKQ